MSAEAQSEPQGVVIRHVISPGYVYLFPDGFMFFHHAGSGDRVGLTYHHDELRVVAERWAPSATQQPEYATETVRVQDATVLIPRDDYLRTVRTTLVRLAEENPGILEKFGIALVPVGGGEQK